MRTRLAPKTALATLAAVGLFLPFGAPLPGSCLRAIGVAGAAPSPSCSGDLRECLRASADLHQTTFGGRYVPAEDVARCMDAYRSCISGGAGRGGNASPPKSTAAGGNGGGALPQHFGIEIEGKSSDCRISAEKVTCTESIETAPDYLDSYTGTVTGTLSGLTMTGTWSARQVSHAPMDPSCVMTDEFSGPVSYTFSTNGTVTTRVGPYQVVRTTGEGCSNTDPRTNPAIEYTGTWSPK